MIDPPKIAAEDEAAFSSNLFKLYKLDDRCNKYEGPSFRIIFIKDKSTMVHVSNHFNSPTCTISYYNFKTGKCDDARTVSKALYNKIYDHYFEVKKNYY